VAGPPWPADRLDADPPAEDLSALRKRAPTAAVVLDPSAYRPPGDCHRPRRARAGDAVALLPDWHATAVVAASAQSLWRPRRRPFDLAGSQSPKTRPREPGS